MSIILCINGTISIIFYERTVALFSNQFSQIEKQWQQEKPDLITPKELTAYSPLFLATYLDTLKSDLTAQLLIINAFILVVIGIAGYFLTVVTLAPIQRTHEEQKRFLADAAHELRTPIAALKTTFEVHSFDPSFTRETHALFKDALKSIDRLHELSEKLLNLTKYDQTTPQIGKIDLVLTIRKVIETMRTLAQKKNIDLRFEASQKSLPFSADRDAITELFTILLDNAIKYSHENSAVGIHIKESMYWIKISITDTGIGISKKQLPYIFKRFYRADQSRNQTKIRGFGLGLSMAERIVQSHQGTISVKSKLNKGTTFTVALPK